MALTVTSPKCGEYIITNDKGADDKLIIKKFINNIGNEYQFEDYVEVDVADTETYTLEISAAEIYSIEWLSDVTDVNIIINTCIIDECILQYINKIVCCDDCLDCGTTCEGTEWITKFNITDNLYVLLVDLIRYHFGEVNIIYPYLTEDYDKVHSINDILIKIENLCSCETAC